MNNPVYFSSPQLAALRQGFAILTIVALVCHQFLDLWGPRLTGELLCLALLTGWVLLVLWEGLPRLGARHKTSLPGPEELAESHAPAPLRSELNKDELESDPDLHDPLTGTFNRAGILRFVEMAFHSNPQRLPVGLMIFDIDHLKRINDRWGHEQGDRILVEFSTQIARNMRPNDCLGRWEGEQFMLVCPRTSRANLLALAEKLRQAIQACTFTATPSPLKLTMSVGGSVMDPEGNFEELLQRATDSLRRAKKAGRNCTFVD